jgi:hypothetical protein
MREFRLPDVNPRRMGKEELLALMVQVQADCKVLRALHPTTSVKVFLGERSDYPRVLWAGDVRGFFEGVLKDVQEVLAILDRGERDWMRQVAEELMGDGR